MRLLYGATVLVWPCLAAAIAGLAIGLWFRVSFLLAMTCIVSVATIVMGRLLGWSYLGIFLSLLLLLAILQASYLVGLWVASRRSDLRWLRRPPSNK